MLAGKEICVVNGTHSHSKSDLEKKVIEFGGTIVQNPGESTSLLVCERYICLETNDIDTHNTIIFQ